MQQQEQEQCQQQLQEQHQQMAAAADGPFWQHSSWLPWHMQPLLVLQLLPKAAYTRFPSAQAPVLVWSQNPCAVNQHPPKPM